MAKIGSIARTPEGKYALRVESGWQLLHPYSPVLPDLNIVEVIYEPNVLDSLGPGSVIYCVGDVYVKVGYGNWEMAGVSSLSSTQEILDIFSEDEIEVLRRG